MPGQIERIREDLFSMRDEEYRDFQSKLIPNADKETVIGVRTPRLKAYAKRLVREDGVFEFLSDLPHKYYDENQLHAFILLQIKDYGKCIAEVERFLPYIDNWSTCDQSSPAVFKKHKNELLSHIREWIKSDRTYTVRFGIGMLMRLYLDGDFDVSYPEAIAGIKSDEYYVNMMIAWYFATALAKQYDAVIPFLEGRRLDVWTHNKAIQKAVESCRITDGQKEYLKSLKIR